MDFRNNPRFSWSCLLQLITTAQEVQADVQGVNLQQASSNTVTKGSDFEMPTAAAAVNDCCDFEIGEIDDGKPAPVQREGSLTTKL